MAKPGRPGAAKGKKSATKGTGGKNKRGLAGRGPTPKAEDRTYHKAHKRKELAERSAAKHPKRQQQGPRRRPNDDNEYVTGRNSVLEALRTNIPATALYIAQRIEMDDRVKEMLTLAHKNNLPMLEVTRPELDRMAGFDGVHQGVALKVPPYEYAHPQDLLEQIIDRGQTPLLVALDGVTDPRNLGAIIRSTAAFGGQGVIVPQRRSAGLNSAAWKTSAGAAARIPVAMAPNLTQVLKDLKKQGVFVLGSRRRRRGRYAEHRAVGPPARRRDRQRGRGTVAPRDRDVRPDRVDSDLGRGRIAQRWHRGIGRALSDLDASRGLTKRRRAPHPRGCGALLRVSDDYAIALSMRRRPVSASKTCRRPAIGEIVTTSPAIGWVRPSTRTTISVGSPSMVASP